MELTIEQVLQKGIAAHKEGNLQDAERLYRAILQSQSAHPEANHNLGIIAVSFHKAAEALPLFKTALEANPKIEQFWLSYIDALIKVKNFEVAKQVVEQAKTQGIAGDKLNYLDAQIASKNQIDKVNNATPSQQQLGSLLEFYQNARFSDAEKLAAQMTQDFPKHAFAWKVLGAVLGATGKMSEAVVANQKAVDLSPQDAEAHSNLGATLKEQGKLDQALVSYTQAVILKPDYAIAHSNLGATLYELGRLGEAEASSRQAIALEPDCATAHSNLGATLHELGRLDEALASYSQAIALKPDYAEAYVNLGIAIKDVKFNSSNPKLYPSLIQLLTVGNFTRPKDVARSILSLLKHDIRIKNLQLEKNLVLSLNDATSIIGSLDKLPLLHQLMRVCPLPEFQFEKLFIAIRSLLLKNLDELKASPELTFFLSTLSMHCFNNEYVYIESEEESYLIGALQANISQTLTQSAQPEAIKILCLASYRSLHHYDWCHKLESLDNFEEVKKRLIEEPLFEKMIAQEIPVLQEISNDVSLKVRGQYEENPYPRWVKLRVSSKAKPIAAVCDELELQLHSESVKNVTAPSILIAGCGTGQHSIGTASRFSNCHVTAVDLSLTSLAYAQRKSNELGFTNIDYLQADILHLRQTDRKFDVVESTGVLHHMDEPLAGWRVLVDLLKPGGLMKIGLYSELARHHIVEVRKEITAQRIGTSKAEIRKFRKSLVESRDENHKRLTTSNDFFSLSTLRDLIFHVQEHRFTLPTIKNSLDELGLKFCGFENRVATSNFRELYSNQADFYDLELWQQFEERNTRAFGGMYQFWCQKL
jgi:Flp pilus assembly protein TadD/2-polyprenyl-3-methyl-5-hydroxy-6-metoxy-1,4-benzoquinol methylase